MQRSDVLENLRITGFAVALVLAVRSAGPVLGVESPWSGPVAGGLVTAGFRILTPRERASGRPQRALLRALPAGIATAVFLRLIL